MEQEPDKANPTGNPGTTPNKWVKFNEEEGETAASQAAAVLETSVEVVQTGISAQKRRGSAPTSALQLPTENLQNVELRYSPRPNLASQITQNGGTTTTRTNTGFSKETNRSSFIIWYSY